jgi:acetoin utilization protein AcuB
MTKPAFPISKYMTTTPCSAQRKCTLAAATKLMRERGIRHLPVMDGDQLLGIISERDIKFAESFDMVDPEQVTVFGAMAEAVYVVSPDTPLDQVVSTMAENRYGSAVVAENRHVVGIFTTVDACRALADLLNGRLPG